MPTPATNNPGPFAPTRRAAGRAVALAIAAAALVLPIGCNIITPVAYLIGGLPKVKPEYVLEERKTVVFVDDRANLITSNGRSLRLSIADRVTEDLMVSGAMLPELMVDPRDAMGIVQSRDRHSDLLPIDAIGRAVEAEIVIYIEVVHWTRLAAGVSRPNAACTVRVIDVTNQTRVFPPPDQVSARTVEGVIEDVDPISYRSASKRLKVNQALAEITGKRIGWLFYEHESRELGGNLNP